MLAPVLLFVAVVGIQPPAARSAADVRRELAEAQAWVANLEAELLRAEGFTRRPLTVAEMRLGQVGYFNDGSHIDTATCTPLRLSKRLGPREAVVSVVVYKGTIPRVVARGIPAADLATDSLIRKPDMWRVVGTRDVGDETLFVIEPYLPVTPPSAASSPP